MSHVPWKNNVCRVEAAKSNQIVTCYFRRMIHALCACLTGDIWGYLKAAAAEREAEMQQFRLVSEEYLPWPSCTWGQSRLAWGCECVCYPYLYFIIYFVSLKGQHQCLGYTDHWPYADLQLPSYRRREEITLQLCFASLIQSISSLKLGVSLGRRPTSQSLVEWGV